jgi:uncharacterized protein (TIGR02246 family)
MSGQLSSTVVADIALLANFTLSSEARNTRMTYLCEIPPNKAFQMDKVIVSHLLQKAQKLRHNNFAAEKRR